MAYVTYANGYNTMYKIDGKYIYSDRTDFSHGEIGTASVSILQDSESGKFLVENEFIRGIIHVALGHYTCIDFGYSESGGKIQIPIEFARIVEEDGDYTDYFSISHHKVLKYKDISYILEQIYIGFGYCGYKQN